MLKGYNLFSKENNKKSDQLNESAPRIPNSEDYWIKKGKIGKEVMIYFHDDLDGIYSATAMKNYLEGKGFHIHGYGVVNYTEGWTTTTLDNKFINIALDYAENVEGIDVYMDHHGSFDLEEVREREKNRGSVKTETTSAYEGIMDQLGLPIDSTIVNVIDMVDSAKYDEHNVDQEVLLNFDPKSFKNKLEFAAAFNQLLKRSDHKTFIEVVANTKDMAPSIYNVYRLFKLLYPANNLNKPWEIKNLAKKWNLVKDDGTPDVDAAIKKLKKVDKSLYRDYEKDFLKDAEWRLTKMQKMTRGSDIKYTIKSQAEFENKFRHQGKISPNGYQLLGNMVFIPSGTWANALRGRSIVETDSKVISKIADQQIEKIPTISYFVSPQSNNYEDLLKRVGQKVELVGDIKYYNTTAAITIKGDVENSSTEGMTGILDMTKSTKGEYLVFRAKQPIFWVMLQYGNTFQVASYHKLDNYDKNYLPKLENGQMIGNLGKYCETLLKKYEKEYGYDINAIESSTTVAGGHKGIGSISNVFGSVKDSTTIMIDKEEVNITNDKYVGSKFMDLIKNEMIRDLAGIEWSDISMKWAGDGEGKPYTPSGDQMNKKTMMSDVTRKEEDIRKENNEDREAGLLKK